MAVVEGVGVRGKKGQRKRPVDRVALAAGLGIEAEAQAGSPRQMELIPRDARPRRLSWQ